MCYTDSSTPQRRNINLRLEIIFTPQYMIGTPLQVGWIYLFLNVYDLLLAAFFIPLPKL